jgi:hypothetical protein
MTPDWLSVWERPPQFVPRGTASPSATTDHVRDPNEVLV